MEMKQKLFTKKLLAVGLVLSCLSYQSLAADGRYIIGYKAGSSEFVRSLVAQARGQVTRDLGRHDALAVSIPARAVTGMQSNPNVLYVEEDARRYAYGEILPYGIPMVQANATAIAQPALTTSKKICIIDSGYDLGHPDLQTSGVTGTWDAGTGDWSTDENGHGTHVAGTIAAVGGNNQGVVGVNNSGGMNLHIIKVFGADGWAYSSDLIAAHDACVTAGADITNMSLGGSFKSRTEDRAFGRSPLLNIAAAGNDGNTRKSYPASYSSVVSVAAVDSAQELASFSQRNSEVELSGPGVSVLSTVPRGTGYESSIATPTDTYESTGMEG